MQELIMTETVIYRCGQCSSRFEAHVLTERERRDAQRGRQPVFPILCPRCNSRDVHRL
jgi:DNA-directed RNA polymerase subunit RPC12/RpoP